MSHILHLLGAPRLETSAGIIPLERRPASILAYLALEGSTPKYKLAGLLWPDSGETAARSNMRQMLRRMRVGGLELITGDDHIALRQDVLTDVGQLSSLDLQHVLELRESGELLEGLDFDDAPDFAEWLESVRHELKNLRYRALETEADRLETEAQFSQALEVSQMLIRLEPLAEDAHRRIMRLHYLAGDRGAALTAFEHCKKTLREEVGATPMPETLKLAKEIEEGINLQKRTITAKTVPLAMLRPPSLVGREKEWEHLETAWQQGQLIFIEGVPGVGKTRLVQEFVASKNHLWLEGRPGDIAVPYSSASRMYRRVLELRPDSKLEPWVRRELTRLIPELGELPEPISSEEDKLRFFEAALSTFSRTTGGLEAVVIDDLQFFDGASIRLGNYTLSKSYPLGQDIPRHLALYRQGELEAEAQAGVEGLVASGVAALIKVEALVPEAVQDLLAHLELDTAKDLAPSLSRYTGGNPLFVLETIRHLHQTGQLERGWPGRLPPPGKVGPLVQRRLERLSEAALQVAQAAAVLKSDFTFELVCEVLGKVPLELTMSWQELETTQVMTGERFSHDLIFEAVQTHTPEAIKRWLNRSAAERLEQKRAANPARIAQHWLEGGEESKAVQWFITAAQQRYSGAEAANLYAQAATIFEAQDEPDKAFEARLAQAKTFHDFELGKAAEELIAKLFTLAHNPQQRARAFLAKAEWLRLVGRFDEVAGILSQALKEAEEARDAGLEALVLERVSASLWEGGKASDALELLRQAQAKAQLSQNPEVMLLTERMLSVVYQNQGDWAAAKPHYQRALNLAEQVGDYNSLALLLIHASLHQVALGNATATLRLAQQAWQLHEDHHGSSEYHQFAARVLWAGNHMQGTPLEAVRLLEPVVREYEGQGYNTTGVVHAALSISYGYLGQLDKAALHFQRARNWPSYPPLTRHMLCIAEATLVQHVRLPLPETFPYEGLAPPEMRLALLAWTKVLPPEQALPLIGRTLELNPHRLRANLIETHTRWAQKLLELGRKEEALEIIQSDLETIKTTQPVLVDRAEVHYTHYCTLLATDKPDALESLRLAHAWVTKVAENLPEEDQKIFVSVNPIAKAILEAANHHRLE